jgi:hypothetical protein
LLASAVSVRAVRSGGRPTYADVRIGDFSGGLNFRDALTELADNETPDCLNVVLDERGGAIKRLGYTRWNTAALPALPTMGFPSSVCNCNFWYSRSDGKLYRDSGGVLSNVYTFTANGRVSVADFVGTTYLIHSVDGLFRTTDGTTWIPASAASGSIPIGDQLAVWQNKLWVANSTSNLLSFCAPGDATKWDSADDAGANYIREGNDFPIVCLYGTSGVDVTAHPALLVGKRSGANGSIHRVTDAATGDYVTIDQSAGPGGPGSITNIYGALYIICPTGIFATDGQSPLQPIGTKLGKFFTPDSIDYIQAANFVAGRTAEGRLRFSFAQAGSAYNDRCLEYHPLFKAFTMRTDAARCYLQALDGSLLGADPSGSGWVWRFDQGGSDAGTTIVSRILTRVFEPGAGYASRLQHIQVLGRNKFAVSALTDFANAGKEKQLDFGAAGFAWDSDGWDDPSVGWGEDVGEGRGDFWPRVDARAFQIKLSETSSATAINPPLNEDGAALIVGAWGCFSLRLSFSLLGPS